MRGNTREARGWYSEEVKSGKITKDSLKAQLVLWDVDAYKMDSMTKDALLDLT